MLLFKVTPWDDTNSLFFLFVRSSGSRTSIIISFFSNFSDLKRHCFINIYKNPGETQNTICTHKAWLNESISLGHILMVSAYRWADDQC